MAGRHVPRLTLAAAPRAACCCRSLPRGMLLSYLVLAAAGGMGGTVGTSPDEIAAGLTLAEVASARHWLRTGEALEAQDRTELALEAFLVASRLDPAPPEPHERMGSIFETRFGDAGGAAPHYRRALRRGSINAQVHYLMGNFASAHGQHELARRLHSAAVALQPSYFEAHNNLGTALISLANAASEPRAVRDYFRSALDALAAAISLQPAHEVPLRTAMTLAHKTSDFRYWQKF